MQTSSMPVSLAPPPVGGMNPTPDKIVWTVTATAPLYLKKLTIYRNTGVDTNSVVGDVSGGTSTSHVARVLQAGPDKFESLKSNCDAADLSESISYDDFDGDLEACNVTPTVIHQALAREVTLERVADGSDTLVAEVKALRKTNEELLSAVKYVSELIVVERERRTSDFAKKAG
jgi:hypothetical protein